MANLGYKLSLYYQITLLYFHTAAVQFLQKLPSYFKTAFEGIRCSQWVCLLLVHQLQVLFPRPLQCQRLQGTCNGK